MLALTMLRVGTIYCGTGFNPLDLVNRFVLEQETGCASLGKFFNLARNGCLEQVQTVGSARAFWSGA